MIVVEARNLSKETKKQKKPLSQLASSQKYNTWPTLDDSSNKAELVEFKPFKENNKTKKKRVSQKLVYYTLMNDKGDSGSNTVDGSTCPSKNSPLLNEYRFFSVFPL